MTRQNSDQFSLENPGLRCVNFNVNSISDGNSFLVRELTLTGKNAGAEGRVPMCGVPYHAAEVYIYRLIQKGYKVAICEQLEDPKKAKGLVKRDVIRVITPGTILFVLIH